MSTKGPPLEGALGTEVKNAQGLLNAGNNSACMSECKAILSVYGSQLNEQTQADVQMMLGRAAVLEKAWEEGGKAYSQASRLRPGAAEGWEGLMDALEGIEEKEKEKQLLEPILHLATIAEDEGNWSRSRSLRLREAIILSSYKERKPEALKVLTTYLRNTAVNVEDANPQDRLEHREMAVRAAILDEDDESCLDFACQALEVTKNKHKSISLTPLDVVVSLDMVEELLERLARIDPSKFLRLHETYVSDTSSSSWAAASQFMSLVLLGGGVSERGRKGTANIYRFPLTKAAILRGKWDQPSSNSNVDQLQQQGYVVELEEWIHESTAKCQMEASLWSVKNLLDSGAVVDAMSTLRRIQFSPPPIMSKNTSCGSQEDWRYVALSVLCDDFRATDPEVALSCASAALSAIEGRKNVFSRVVPGSPGWELRSNLVHTKAKLLLDTGAVHDSLQVVEMELKTDSLRQTDICKLICLKANLVAQQGQFDEAISLFREAIRIGSTNAMAYEEAGWFYFTGGEEDATSSSTTLNPSAAIPLLEKSVELQGTSRQCYRLALCYWEAGGTKKEDRSWCFTMLLRAAKQDPDGPFASKIFAHLGLWYAEVGKDDVRSEGCFRKSLKLNPQEELAGQHLVEICCSRGDVTEAVALLKMSSSIDPRSHWAWAGLSRDCAQKWVLVVRAREGRGGQEIVDKDDEVEQGLLTQAVGYMQQALKGSPGKWQYWSELGWLYLRKGMHASALKTLQEALTLLEKIVDAQEHSNLHNREIHKVAVLQIQTNIARVHREIGQVDEAVSVIESALAFNFCNPVTLMGAGEYYLAQAHARSMEGLYYASYQSLQKGQQAMNALLADRQRELKLKHGLKFIQAAWKLLGDLYIYCHKLPPTCCGGEGMGGLGGWFSEQQKVIALASEAYNEVKMAAVETGERGDIAAAEYDTGLAFLLSAKSRRMELGEGSGLWKTEQYAAQPDILELLSKAASCFRESLLLDPTSCKAWVGMGCSSISDTSLQQHCFIRAVQIDRQNREAWINLAVLYFCQGKISQVNNVLNTLQSIVVDHPLIWVMLGLIRLKHQEVQAAAAATPQNQNIEMGIKETCDAFYSSLQIAQPVDGLLGLARTASMVESLQDGITAAEIYCDLNPGNPLAYALLGLFLMDEEKFVSAAECHCIALELIVMQRTLLGTSFESSKAEKLVLSNLADAVAAGWASFPSSSMYHDVGGGGGGGSGVEHQHQCFFSLRVNNMLKNPPSPFSCFSLAMLRLGLQLRGDSCSCNDFMTESLNQSKSDFIDDDDDSGGVSSLSRESARIAFKALLEYSMNNWVPSPVPSILSLSFNSLHHDLAGTIQAARNEFRNISSFLSSDHAAPCYNNECYPRRGLEAAHQLRTVAIALSAAGAPPSSSRKVLCHAIHLYPRSPLLWEELGGTLLREAPNELYIVRLASYCGEAANKLVTSIHKDTEQRGLAYFRGTDGPFGSSPGRCDEGQCHPARVSAKAAARAINVKAVARLAMGSSIKSSLRSLLKSLHICPGLPETWQALALALLGDYNLNSIMASDSDSSCKDLINIGQRIFSIMGCDVEAKLYKALIGDVGENWARTEDDHLSQARWYACRGDDWGNAIEHYKHILMSQNSTLKYVAAVELSLCYEHCGKNNEAVECLRYAVGSLEESLFQSALLLHLAVTLHRQGCNSESMEAVNKASRSIISNGLSSSILSFLRGALWSGMNGKDSVKKAKNALNRVIVEEDSCIPPQLVHAYLDTMCK